MSNKHLSMGIYIVLAIALISSIATAGYYRSQYLQIKDLPPKEVVKEVKVEDPQKDAEIAELKKQLEELGKKNPAAVVKAPETKPQPPAQNDRRGGPRMSLEEMKVNDPERYQKVMEHYTSMNSRMASGVADKMVFFNELDTTGMTDEELENHQALLEKLAKMHEATEKATATDNPEDIQNTMRSQFQNFRELNTLMQKERNFLILDAGRKMGFDDKESQLLRDYVNNAYEITSGRSFFGRGGGNNRTRTPRE